MRLIYSYFKVYIQPSFSFGQCQCMNNNVTLFSRGAHHCTVSVFSYYFFTYNTAFIKWLTGLLWLFCCCIFCENWQSFKVFILSSLSFFLACGCQSNMHCLYWGLEEGWGRQRVTSLFIYVSFKKLFAPQHSCNRHYCGLPWFALQLFLGVMISHVLLVSPQLCLSSEWMADFLLDKAAKSKKQLKLLR